MAGGSLFVCTMTTLRWDFAGLSTIQYKTNTYVVTEDFQDITIDSEIADILFLPTYDGRCRVVCDEETNTKYIVEVVDGTLTIEFVSDKSISDYIRNIGINLYSPKLTIYLPKAEYQQLTILEDTGDIKLLGDFHFESIDLSLHTGDVSSYASVSGLMKIKTTTGDIRVENVSADEVELTVSTGDVHLEDLQCNTLQSSGNTGDIHKARGLIDHRVTVQVKIGDDRASSCGLINRKIYRKGADLNVSIKDDLQAGLERCIILGIDLCKGCRTGIGAIPLITRIGGAEVLIHIVIHVINNGGNAAEKDIEQNFPMLLQRLLQLSDHSCSSSVSSRTT
jgi:ribosomal protein L21E